jgi:hypothetical protein
MMFVARERAISFRQFSVTVDLGRIYLFFRSLFRLNVQALSSRTARNVVDVETHTCADMYQSRMCREFLRRPRFA